MDHLKMIHQYLKDKSSVDLIPTTGYPFVTITRQAGGGGHLLAQVIITDFLKEEDKELFSGWHVFDREVCELVAEDPELKVSIETLLAEHYRSEFQDFFDTLFTGRSEQYLRYKKTFQIVRILSLIGKVILVGSAGSFVTRDLPSGVRIRLVAPEATRTRWLMKKFQLSKEEARKMMLQQDAERHKMVRSFFGQDIEDPLTYDAVFNSDRADLHEISHAVIAMIKRRRLQNGHGQP